MTGTVVCRLTVGCICSVNKSYASSNRTYQAGHAPVMRPHSKGREPSSSGGALQCSACKIVQRTFQELPALRQMAREGLVFLLPAGNN